MSVDYFILIQPPFCELFDLQVPLLLQAPLSHKPLLLQLRVGMVDGTIEKNYESAELKSCLTYRKI